MPDGQPLHLRRSNIDRVFQVPGVRQVYIIGRQDILSSVLATVLEGDASLDITVLQIERDGFPFCG